MKARHIPSIYHISVWPLKLCMACMLMVTCDRDLHDNSLRGNTLCQCRRRWAQLLVGLVPLLVVICQWLLLADAIIYPATDLFSWSIHIVNRYVIMLTVFVVQVESNWKSDWHKTFFDRLEKVRHQLAEGLGHEVDCNRIRLYSRLLYALLLAKCVPYAVLLGGMHLKGFNSLLLLLYGYLEALISVKLVEFMLYAMLLMSFLKELCGAGDAVRQALHCSRFDVWHVRRTYLVRLFLLQDLHAQLWELLRYVEQYFEWSLPVLLLEIFFDLNLMWYWLFITFECKKFYFVGIFCAFVIAAHLTYFFCCTYICSALEQWARRFRRIFYYVESDRRNPYLGASLRRISLQLMHERISISVGSIGHVNMRILGKIIIAVISYAVIIIQFRMSNSN